MAGRDRMKVSANAGWITCAGIPSGPIEEARWLRQKSPRWSAGRRACPRWGRRGAFAKVPSVYLRRSGALPPSGEATKTRAESPGGKDKAI